MQNIAAYCTIFHQQQLALLFQRLCACPYRFTYMWTVIHLPQPNL